MQSNSELSTPRAGNTGSSSNFFPVDVVPVKGEKGTKKIRSSRTISDTVTGDISSGSILERLTGTDSSFCCADQSNVYSDEEELIADADAGSVTAGSAVDPIEIFRSPENDVCEALRLNAEEVTTCIMTGESTPTIPIPDPLDSAKDTMAPGPKDITSVSMSSSFPQKIARNSSQDTLEYSERSDLTSDHRLKGLDFQPSRSTAASVQHMESVDLGATPSLAGTVLASACEEGDKIAASISEESSSRNLSKSLGNNRNRAVVSGSFPVSCGNLMKLSEERSLLSLADLIERAHKLAPDGDAGDANVEEAEGGKGAGLVATSEIRDIVHHLREGTDDQVVRSAKASAVTVLTNVLLRSSTEYGLNDSASSAEMELRKKWFGENSIPEKSLDSFCKLCWDAFQDFVLIMLTFLGIIIIAIEVITHPSGIGWIEGFAVLMAVCIVVLVTATIDYQKQNAFLKLMKNLDDSNTKSAVRGGHTIEVVDADIVVGDILNINAHNLESIPADCVVLAANNLQLNEASLTGESILITKDPGDVVLSGTTVQSGSAKVVVVAVGINSVAGKIKARVYADEGGDDLIGDTSSPLTSKLESIAKKIGWGGTLAAAISLLWSCVAGFALSKPREELAMLVDYVILAITVLAVAVPEGLPLAVTLSLAFSSNKMMSDQNLVKQLDSCETMGCATTICTDKTGTLTANKMTVRAMYTNDTDYTCNDPAQQLGDHILMAANKPNIETLQIISTIISVNTMNESVLYLNDDKKKIVGTAGNPTECALLALAHHLGSDYKLLRDTTRGRSSAGEFANYLEEGKLFMFSSARKMMSWAVPTESGGFRLYSKGATEVLLSRCSSILRDGPVHGCSPEIMTEVDRLNISQQLEIYARRGMRTLALAYRDVGHNFEVFSLEDEGITGVKNSDGSPAYSMETRLIFVALMGIEDPLRAEVPDAIQKCYTAGIDVRMVTGDSPNTAVSIAYQAGILKRELHFLNPGGEMVASNLKKNVLLEGKDFREAVHIMGSNGTLYSVMPFFLPDSSSVLPRLHLLLKVKMYSTK